MIINSKPSVFLLIIVLILLALPGTLVQTVEGYGFFDSWGGRRVGYSGGYFEPQAFGPQPYYRR